MNRQPVGFNLSACGLSPSQQWEFWRLWEMPFDQHPPALQRLIQEAWSRFESHGLILPGVIVAYLKHQTFDEFLTERGYVPIGYDTDVDGPADGAGASPGDNATNQRRARQSPGADANQEPTE